MSSDPPTPLPNPIYWFQGENIDPRPHSDALELQPTEQAIPVGGEGQAGQAHDSHRTPLGELPANARYPLTHHIPHPLSTISHTRVWLPNSFP